MGDTYQVFEGDQPIDRFEVRDNRAQTRFFIDNSFYDEFVPVFGSSLAMVYVALVRHANKQQKTWPSQTRLAEQLGLSRKWVGVQLQILECFNLIRTIRVGKACTNRYYLIDEKHWRRDFEVLAQELVAQANQQSFSLPAGLKKVMRTEFPLIDLKVMGTEFPSVMRTPVGRVANATSLKMAVEFASNRKVKQSKVTQKKRKRTVVKKMESQKTQKAVSTKFSYVFDEASKTMVEKPIDNQLLK